MYMRKVCAIGPIAMVEQEGRIVRLVLNAAEPLAAEAAGESELLERAFRQLEEYLAGTRTVFDLPLAPSGTVFQRRVWAELERIVYGGVASYKDIAVAIGNPGAVRAVGMANNRNPIAIFIPCHRVIGSDGSLVGYGGGLALKRHLLELEARNSGRMLL